MLTTRAPRRSSRRVAGVTIMCAGLVVIVVGTFLPWLTSGRVTRNSYSASTLLRRLLEVDGAAAMGLRVWPYIGLVCTLAVALLLVGRTRAGAIVAILAAVASAAVALGTMLRGSNGLIHPAQSGPTTTLVGAVVALLAALPFLVTERSTRRIR